MCVRVRVHVFLHACVRMRVSMCVCSAQRFQTTVDLLRSPNQLAPTQAACSNAHTCSIYACTLYKHMTLLASVDIVLESRD